MQIEGKLCWESRDWEEIVMGRDAKRPGWPVTELEPDRPNPEPFRNRS